MKPAAAPGIALGEARGEGVVHRFAHAAMATVFEVRCAHHDAAYAGQAAHAAFLLLDRLEQELSRFIPNSDVSRVNALRAGQATRVSPATLECLALARELLPRTSGAFDVSIGTGLDRLELVPDGCTVHARADGVRLDLGGLGKGYAVDRMGEVLEEWGIDRALAHGGQSSVVALRPPPDREGWPLTFSSPWPGQERVVVRREARLEALSASGTRKGGHIVDPRSGGVARSRAAWAVLSLAAGGERPAAVAEGLSTAFMILPIHEIEGLCRDWPGLEAWLAPEPAEGDPPPGALVHVVGTQTSHAAGGQSGDNAARQGHDQ